MPRPRTVDDRAILAAAADAVRELGPARLTLAHVGSRAGLSPSTLVQRFGSKRSLLLALAAHDAGRMPDLVRAAAHDPDPLATLTDVLEGFAASVGSAREFANHLAFLLMDLSDEEFQQVSRRHAAAMERAIEDVLLAAVAKGQVELALPTREVARLVHTVYNGALVTWGMAPRGTARNAVAAALAALLDPLRAPS